MMLSHAPRVAVMILFYNDESHVTDVLSTTLRQTYDNYDVICIDNASTDQTLPLIQTSFPHLRIIINQRNLGYAGAYKAALNDIFRGNYDAAVLLNSDVIVDNNWLAELVASAYAEITIAIAQPKIFLYDGRGNALANTFGNKIHYLGFGFCGQYKQKDTLPFTTDAKITSASGACMLIKKEAYYDIGELDEKFFAYVEDQDLSWRAGMKGYEVVLSAKSVMWHKYIFSINPRNRLKFFLLERNRLFFIFKNYSAKTMVLIAPAFLFMEIGIFIDSLFKGYCLDKIKSYVDFIRNIGYIRVERHKLQRERRIPDRELFANLHPTIDFEEIGSPLLRLANVCLKMYYHIIKSHI
jgi:GT2 family glycosyltransferase